MKKLTILLAGIIIVSACAAPSDSAGSTTSVPPGTVILTVTAEGGFVPVEFLVNRGPRYVLTADGHLYFEGPYPTIYPGPMLSPYVVTQLDEATVDQILALVSEIGFPEFNEVRNTEAANRVADATTTIVTFSDVNGAHTFAVYALGIGEQSDPRVPMLSKLVRRLGDAGSSGDLESYPGDRLMVHVVAGGGNPDFPDLRPWPLPEPPDQLSATNFQGWRCAVYEGDTASSLVTTFSTATQATTWTNAGTEYVILARALLPGETGCV